MNTVYFGWMLIGREKGLLVATGHTVQKTQEVKDFSQEIINNGFRIKGGLCLENAFKYSLNLLIY